VGVSAAEVPSPAAVQRPSPTRWAANASPGPHAGRSLLSNSVIAVLSVAGIALHLAFAYLFHFPSVWTNAPLYPVLLVGGSSLLLTLFRKLAAGEFGSDLLAGISIVASVIQGQYLVGAIIVLMLSGGGALEIYSARRASSVLKALAKRVPRVAHRKTGDRLLDIPLDRVAIGDCLVVHPHEVCPVDGIVLQGHTRMNEAFLTGEPFELSKAPGSQVISGALNGESAIVIRADKLPVDSRYARIMRVMEENHQRRPRLRRLGDQLGAWYTPLALLIASLAWILTGQSRRFLAVLVVATPCPLLIAIPVAVIGAISVAARSGIIIKNPAILEQVDACRTFIFDKTGTLTYGRPNLAAVETAPGFSEAQVISSAASLESYSRHPLAQAILDAAKKINSHISAASEIREPPGKGLEGIVDGHSIRLTGRKQVAQEFALFPVRSGLECVVLIDEKFAAVLHFQDTPRAESRTFVQHLQPRHQAIKVILLSGDRDAETRYLAGLVGIREVHGDASPEEKVAIVRDETRLAKTLFVGDGINDAPAMQAATVGVAFGQSSDITAEAADAVILDSSLRRVDQLIHIGRRMRSIALLSAVGGMALSVIGMFFAAVGLLPAIGGAIAQEIIDLAAVLNSIRMAVSSSNLDDF